MYLLEEGKEEKEKEKEAGKEEEAAAAVAAAAKEQEEGKTSIAMLIHLAQGGGRDEGRKRGHALREKSQL